MLEDYLLALSSPSPHIGYIGHASNDDPDRISAFYARFEGVAHTSHLLIEADATAAEAFVADLDILYVGGGSTIKMLSHWREAGIDTVILAAGRRGMILSGVSAGAICWFEQLLLSTADNDYILAEGLGLIGGSACPHYSNEPSRQIAYDTQIRDGNLLSGVAIDDGVGVHITNGAVTKVVRAGAGNAYLVKACSNAVRSAREEIECLDGREIKCDVSLLKAGDALVF
jgi:peptidase E